jgi:DNA-directed RNA polymerase subunit alpha
VEARKSEGGKLPIGTVAIDAIFSPVRSVNFVVENMRVGDRTDYNRLRIDIETDGTISPSSGLRKASSVLRDHFDKVFEVSVQEFETEKVQSPKAKGKSKKTASP